MVNMREREREREREHIIVRLLHIFMMIKLFLNFLLRGKKSEKSNLFLFAIWYCELKFDALDRRAHTILTGP